MMNLIRNILKEKQDQLPQGVTLLFALLLISLVLIITVTVSTINFKELVVTNTIRESQDAFYAAEGGLQCLRYWAIRDQSYSCDNCSFPENIRCLTDQVTTFDYEIAGANNSFENVYSVDIEHTPSGEGSAYALTSWLDKDDYGFAEDAFEISVEGYNQEQSDTQRILQRRMVEQFPESCFSSVEQINVNDEGSSERITNAYVNEASLDEILARVIDDAYSDSYGNSNPYANANQKGFELWSIIGVDSGTIPIMDVSMLSDPEEAGENAAFGYYYKSDIDRIDDLDDHFHPIARVDGSPGFGTGEEISGYDFDELPILGYSSGNASPPYPFYLDQTDDIGFAIYTTVDDSWRTTESGYYTREDFNSYNVRGRLVTSFLTDNGHYALAFEDGGGDSDFNDVVVRVRLLNCRVRTSP